MRVGIIAEGTEDQAVIKNILRAFNIDGYAIRPSLGTDESGKHLANQSTIGTFQGVKNACLQPDDFERALNVLGDDFLVIHLDTAEIDQHDFPFIRPNKTDTDYCVQLLQKVIEQINAWLDNNYQAQLVYAICIEEIEAWILTLYLKEDTSEIVNVKNKLKHLLSVKNITSKGCSTNADFYEKKVSCNFRKTKTLQKCLPYNKSLLAFVESINAKLN